jgi:hypothetical protein
LGAQGIAGVKDYAPVESCRSFQLQGGIFANEVSGYLSG